MKQAELCKCGTLKDELIRDRLVSGIQDDKIRERLLSKKAITSAKTIELLKASEATRHQALDMATTELEPTSTVQVTKTNQQVKQTKGMSGQHTRVRSGKPHKSCRYCGRQHEFTREACPAFDKTCFNCNKRGHFSKQCRAPRIHHVEDQSSEDEEVFFINAIKTSASQPALVTCTVNNSHKVVFEIDTGASCNILPFVDYIKATGDKQGTHINPTRTHLTMHNDTS